MMRDVIHESASSFMPSKLSGARRPKFSAFAPPKLPSGPVTQTAAREYLARKIAWLINSHGLNQQEFARQYEAKFGEKIDKGSVSHWVRGHNQPEPHRLTRIAEFFDIPIDELMPEVGYAEATLAEPADGFTFLEDGNIWLRINRPVSSEAAQRIMGILTNETRGNRKASGGDDQDD